MAGTLGDKHRELLRAATSIYESWLVMSGQTIDLERISGAGGNLVNATIEQFDQLELDLGVAAQVFSWLALQSAAVAPQPVRKHDLTTVIAYIALAEGLASIADARKELESK